MTTKSLAQALAEAPYLQDHGSWQSYLEAVHARGQDTRVRANAAKVVLGAQFLDRRPKSRRLWPAWLADLQTKEPGLAEGELEHALAAAEAAWRLPDELRSRTDAVILDRPLADLARVFKSLLTGSDPDQDAPRRPPSLRTWTRQARRLIDQLIELPDDDRDVALQHLLDALDVWVPGGSTLSLTTEPEEATNPSKPLKSRRTVVAAARAEKARTGETDE